MLILTRRPGESVMIGDDITITVLAIKGNQLRLGFTAPQNIAVHREEVYQRIQAGKITNILQAKDGNPPVRLLDQHVRARIRGPNSRAYVEPSHGPGSVELSPQTRQELLRWEGAERENAARK